MSENARYILSKKHISFYIDSFDKILFYLFYINDRALFNAKYVKKLW